MEGGAGGSAASPAKATGGMCGRFFTFLANGLSVGRQKRITEGPRNGGSGGGGYHQLEEEDEFAIPIERAEFEFSDRGDEGHGQAMTVLEDTSTAAAIASDEQQQHQKQRAATYAAAERDSVVSTASDEQKRAATDAAEDSVVATASDDQNRAATDAAAEKDSAAAAAPAAEETKIRNAVTIKEERPEDATAADGSKGAPALERKKRPFRKRKASTSSGGTAGEEEHGARVRRGSGLRPRTLAVLRVPSDINEKSSTFIDKRRKSFGGKSAPAADDKL